MKENLRLLFRLYSEPVVAMSAILDRGSLLFASLSVLAVSVGLDATGGWLRFPFYAPLLVLAIAYVPGLLLLCAVVGRFGGFGTSFRRDYAPLLTCAGLAWSAVNLPLLVAAWAAPFRLFAAVGLLAYLYFAVLMFFAVRTVFGAGNGPAAVAVSLSWVSLVAMVYLWIPLRMVLGYIASPFFLFYAWYFLGSEFSGLGAGMRGRQTFRRMLEAAAVNPHDGEAQYQLGLIYQQRRNYAEAIERFEAAVKIDPSETDAHFQLGRIAHEQGRLDDAPQHFQTVLAQDPKHSLSEILRELGAAYLAAGRLPEALTQLQTYVERRPYDPEGLYYCGLTLEKLFRAHDALAMYTRAVEAARTAPRYLRRSMGQWSRLAQRQKQKLKSRY